MKTKLWFLFSLLISINFLNAQDLVIPTKTEDEVYIKLKRFEGIIDVNQNIEDILKYDPRFVEEIIFKHIEEIEAKKPKILTTILKILGHFDSPRSILTLGKYAEPFMAILEKDKPIPRPRHIRVSAINALTEKISEERLTHVIKHISDADPIFQSLVLKLLTEKEVKEAIDPAYEIFKKSNTEATFNVKTDAASLLMAISKDPQLKNSVLLSMLIDPNIHIRKAGLTLLTSGGEAGDAEVRRKLIDILKNAKTEELELACKGVGTIKAMEAKDELLIVLNREKSPLIKWECLNSLSKINYDKNELNNKIKEIITNYQGNENIKNAERERFQKLLEYLNAPKEPK